MNNPNPNITSNNRTFQAISFLPKIAIIANDNHIKPNKGL